MSLSKNLFFLSNSPEGLYFQCPPHPWPWPWIFKVNFWKSCIKGMGWTIDMEQKGCESIICYTHFVAFNVHLTHDLDLGFSRSNFENAVSLEWECRLTLNERDLSRQNVRPMLWLSIFTSSMTLTLDFQGQIFTKSYLRNGMADWHETKGMWFDRMLNSPWPWIFNVKFWNCCNLGMGGSTHLEWKECELDMMLDAQWDWPWAMPSYGSMWNSYSFQPVGQWMGYSFTDLGALYFIHVTNRGFNLLPNI